MKHRPIYEIASEIKMNWENPYFGAVPYLDAMMYLYDINSVYGFDTAYSIIIYFLSNARTWKGETARKVKKELKEIIGG
jgi:hypothetical protein